MAQEAVRHGAGEWPFGRARVRESRTVPAKLRLGAGLAPDAAYAAVEGCQVAGATPADAVARWVGALHALGGAKGDRVAVLVHDRPERLPGILGCGGIGAVPVNAALRGPQGSDRLGKTGARLLLADAAFAPVVAAIDPGLCCAVPVRWTAATDPDTAIGPAATTGEPVDAEPGDPVVIPCPSGRTDPSTGVVWPHAQVYRRGRHPSRLRRVGLRDRLVTALPLFHADARDAFRQAQLTGATVVDLHGAMVPTLLSQAASRQARGRRIRTGRAPGVPGPLMDAFEARTGGALLDGRVATASGFGIGMTAQTRMPASIGRVADGFAAPEPHALASGCCGMPERTAEGWRHSGDRATRRGDGRPVAVGRRTDARWRRGENIASREVEQVLHIQPGVDRAAVFPVASDLVEDAVMGAVVLRDRGGPPGPFHHAAAGLALPREAGR